MIRLTAVGAENSTELLATEPVFRITGAAVWIPHRVSRGTPLAHYSGGLWQHERRLWSGLRFDGPCRLSFGLPRDPAGTSDELRGISVHGARLIANGLPFAVYEADKDMWHGADRWWHAFRIEYVSIAKATSADTSSVSGRRSAVLVVSPTLVSGAESPLAAPDSNPRSRGS